MLKHTTNKYLIGGISRHSSVSGVNLYVLSFHVRLFRFFGKDLCAPLPLHFLFFLYQYTALLQIFYILRDKLVSENCRSVRILKCFTIGFYGKTASITYKVTYLTVPLSTWFRTFCFFNIC